MMTLRAAVAGGLAVSLLGLLGASPVQADGVPTLTGFASLPAATFVPGSEPSGSLLGTAPINGVAVGGGRNHPDRSLLVDLLNIADPKHLGGSSDVFRFPFTTIEDVIVLDDRTIAVLNDNNFPFSSGRTPGAPDNNEFITVRLPRKI